MRDQAKGDGLGIAFPALAYVFARFGNSCAGTLDDQRAREVGRKAADESVDRGQVMELHGAQHTGGGILPDMSLPIIFVTVSVVELLVLAAVEDRIGLGPTLAIILFTGILGASLVRSQGFSVLVRVRNQMSQGVFPGRELAHGALVLIGGALLLTPGFLTDALGFALMVPTFREIVRRRGTSFLQRRAPLR
jgi:UPF0716 protein FxsA